MMRKHGTQRTERKKQSALYLHSAADTSLRPATSPYQPYAFVP